MYERYSGLPLLSHPVQQQHIQKVQGAAFWGGFFATEFVLANRSLLGGAPHFYWAINKPNGWGALFTADRMQWVRIQSFIQATFTLVGWIVIGIIFGFMCVYIRSRCQSKKT